MALIYHIFTLYERGQIKAETDYLNWFAHKASC